MSSSFLLDTATLSKPILLSTLILKTPFPLSRGGAYMQTHYKYNANQQTQEDTPFLDTTKYCRHPTIATTELSALRRRIRLWTSKQKQKKSEAIINNHLLLETPYT